MLQEATKRAEALQLDVREVGFCNASDLWTKNLSHALKRQAIPSAEKAITWNVSYRNDRSLVLGPHLYNGTCGVAIFLAAYHYLYADNEAADLAVRALASLRLKLSRIASGQSSRPSLPLGGFAGIGAFLYTFSHMAHWLQRDDLLESACEAATILSRERIAAGGPDEVVTGIAGALLALLRLESDAAVSPRERARALDMAVLCGQVLVERRTSQAGGPRAWSGSDGLALPGFAHGAAGIAHALLRLFARTGQDGFRAAALEGYAFERSLYDSAARTWLDPRTGRPLEQAAWCHGAPGIALGRLGSILDEPAVGADLDLAVALTRALPETRRDHLCCGNFGRVEILSTLGRACGRPELVDDARRLAERRLAHWKGTVTNDTPTDDTPQPVDSVSFFWGAAGIGYTLLRLQHPHLPCVLLLE